MDWQSRWFRVLPVVLVMGAIFFQSHQSGDSFSLPKIVNIDKVLHGLVYAVLGLTALLALSPQFRGCRPLLANVAVVVFCLVYGISDELHQSFVPGRMVSAGDILADTVGGAMAVLGNWGWQRWKLPGGGIPDEHP